MSKGSFRLPSLSSISSNFSGVLSLISPSAAIHSGHLGSQKGSLDRKIEKVISLPSPPSACASGLATNRSAPGKTKRRPLQSLDGLKGDVRAMTASNFKTTFAQAIAYRTELRALCRSVNQQQNFQDITLEQVSVAFQRRSRSLYSAEVRNSRAPNRGPSILRRPGSLAISIPNERFDSADLGGQFKCDKAE